MTTKQIGDVCEDYAKEYLEKNGIEIILTNFYCREGEIDIVAREDEYTVFVEVKARQNTLFGMPCEAVTKSKQKKLIMAAQRYFEQSEDEMPARFDVIEILYKPFGEKICVENINHIRGAFELT
ncbi:MAG: YraN family protein [Ruminococcaceae bacterium]|nr:YraN family protein [Oscillospiraceae bacterium]